MPRRHYSNGDLNYRYGFNGQEKDDEIQGKGNSYTAWNWQYDPRLGRRMNNDPLTYAWHGAYVVLNANPNVYTDQLGLKPGNGLLNTVRTFRSKIK